MATTLTPVFAAGSRRFSVRNVIALVQDWNDARRTRRALGQLSVSQLDDIGLVPGDIERIATRRF